MQTIAILPESNSGQPAFRAICGPHQATGKTLGQALDSLEEQLQASGLVAGKTVVFVQRFRPDQWFTEPQQKRLQDLMAQFHAAIAQGEALEPDLQAELEMLVEAELQANISRSQSLLRQTQSDIQAS